MKKMILKIMAVIIFALMMAFNVTTTINSKSYANIDVSLTGSEAIAQSPGRCDFDTECGVNQVCLGGICVTGNRCAYGGTWDPSESYTDCTGCSRIYGYSATEIWSCTYGN